MENQFIPLPINPDLNRDLAAQVKIQLKPGFREEIEGKGTRNKSHRLQSRSLMRPTPVKNGKIVADPEEDDVISEMRSLTVRPTQNQYLGDSRALDRSQGLPHNTARMRSRGLEVENETKVDSVSVKTKRKLLKWLEDINLLRRKAVSIKEFPQFCRNGVIFFDLINKLAGREPVLKGIQRNPKNVT